MLKRTPLVTDSLHETISLKHLPLFPYQGVKDPCSILIKKRRYFINHSPLLLFLIIRRSYDTQRIMPTRNTIGCVRSTVT